MLSIHRVLWLSAILAASLSAQTVASTTGLSVSQSSINQGTVVTLTATVTVNGAPAIGGTVNFLDGTRSLGTVQVIVAGAATGTAVLKTRSFAVGSHNLTASYSGALNGAQHAGASNSTAVALMVQASGAGISITKFDTYQDPSGGPFYLDATVTGIGGPPPTGTVNFTNQTSGVSLGAAAIFPGASGTFPQETQMGYTTSTNPASITVGDFNKDGILDVAVANGDSTVSVLLGDPSNPGHFLDQVKYPTGQSPTSIVTADFNGDGVLDLAPANGDGTVSVLLGNLSAPGQFTSPASYATGSGGMLVVADFNLDGLPDIANVGNSTVVLLNNLSLPGALTSQPATFPMGLTAGFATSAAVADFNGDGYPDLAVNNPEAATVFFGDPNHPGQFVPQNPYSSCRTSVCSAGYIILNSPNVVVGDFNQDGVPDMAVSAGFSSGGLQRSDVIIFLGDSVNRGRFLPATVIEASTDSLIGALAVGDFDGDGISDIAIMLDFDNIVSDGGLLLGDPTQPGQFQPFNYVSFNSGQAVGLVDGDFAGDGLPSLAYAIGGEPSIQVLLNSSSSFATVEAPVIAGSQTIVASYSGDSNYQASISASQTVAGSIVTTTTLAISAFTAGQGEAVTFSATVSAAQGNAPSSGSVVFLDGAAVLGAVPVTSQGAATYVTSTLAPGSHQISAAYQPGGIWLASSSSSLTITVTQSQTPAPGSGLLFVPITPCRIMDTRGNGFSGAFGAPSLTNTDRDLPVPQSACGIPGNAMAYSLNVTAVPQGPLGYLSVWPTGLLQPTVSTLNSYDGRVVANAAIVPAGRRWVDRFIREQHHRCGSRHQRIFRVSRLCGSFGVLSGYALPRCRYQGEWLHGIVRPTNYGGCSSRSFPIQQSTCGIPATAQAYALNMTAVPSNGSPLYYLTAWPTGQPQPYVSTLDSWTRDVVANAAIVPAGSSGSVDVFATNDTDVVIDINGYFAPPGATGALSYYPVTPCRMVDTRGNGFSGLLGPPSLVPGTSRDLPLESSACSIPATTQAYSLNVTVVPQGPLGFLALWPTGQAQPYVSTLNSWRGEVLANAALVPAGNNGSVTVVASNPTDVVIDVNGVFAP